MDKVYGKIIVIQVVYNNRQWIEPVLSSVFNQTFKDLKFVAVIAGNDDGSKELITSRFPEVEIIDPGFNIGFAKGHNLVFEKYPEAEFFQLVNPDLILEPTYIENMLKAFEDEKVGAATGKLYKIPNDKFQKTNKIQNPKSKILDTTGVVISKSGRARDRGQHEVDTGQYDTSVNVEAVSAAGAMYRRSALLATRYPFDKLRAGTLHANSYEYFDEDFHSYWEDVDLAWRMANGGWKNVFVPQAIGFHGRTAGSSKKGYMDVIGFIKHHRALPERIRQLNYKNHIFMYIKNSRWFYPQFFVREFFMLIYVLLFETSTLKVLPEMFRQFPKIRKKRKLIVK